MNAQGWASENSGAYLEVLNHLLDDYSSENIEFAKGLVNECLSQDIEDTEALDYVISKIIVEQIDDSQLDDCTKGVLNDLKNLENNDISKMMRRFDMPNGPYKIKIIKGSIPSPGGLQVILGNTSGSIDDILITLNQNYFNQQKGTRLLKAAVIMHEMLHALMYSIIYDYDLGNNSS